MPWWIMMGVSTAAYYAFGGAYRWGRREAVKLREKIAGDIEAAKAIPNIADHSRARGPKPVPAPAKEL